MRFLPASLILPLGMLAGQGLVCAQAVREMPGGAVRAPKKAFPKNPDKMARRLDEIERFDRMTPEVRRRALDNLPPERRRRIEQGLAQYHAMDPANRERLRNFQDLPADRRDALRGSVRRMQELPPGRRAAVRNEMQLLRGMAPGDREVRLQSDAFRRRFDAYEQSIIRDTVANLPPQED